MELVWPTEQGYNRLIARIIHLASYDVVEGVEGHRETGIEFLQALGAKPAQVEQWYKIERENNYHDDKVGVDILTRRAVPLAHGNCMDFIKCRVCGKEMLMRHDQVIKAKSCGCMRGNFRKKAKND